MKDEFEARPFNRGLKAFLAAAAEGEGAEAKRLMLDLNAFTHAASVSRSGAETIEDAIWERGDPGLMRSMAGTSMYSAAWQLWHSARVEDICSHAFLSGGEQVLEEKGYRKSLGIKRVDTGNSFDSGAMEEFNRRIDLEALKRYRADVGKATRAMMRRLAAADLKRRVDPDALAEIGRRGYVDSGSAWLLDFWGKKRISGIVAMPLTRHVLVHLNGARRRLRI
jgi:hypothetical protein